MARSTPAYKDQRRTQADVLLGQNIVRARVDRGLSQSELAQKLEDLTGTSWDQVKISNYETCRRLLTLPQVYQVAMALDVNVKDLTPSVTTEGEERSPYLRHRPDMPMYGYPVERAPLQ